MKTSEQKENIDDFSQIVVDNMVSLRRTLTEILNLLLHSKHETAMTEALSKVMAFFDADRVYIGTFNEKEDTISFIHEVATDENSGKLTTFLKSKFDNYNFLTEQELPWWFNNIKKGIDTIVSDINQLPEEAGIEQDLMKKNEVKSFLTCSTYNDGNINGFIGIGCIRYLHQWNKLDIENLHMFADLFSIATEKELVQKTMMKNATEALKQDTIFRIIFEKIPVGIELYDKEGDLISINPYDMEILGTTKENLLGVNLFENPMISESSKNKIKNGEETDFEGNYNFKIIHDKKYYSSNFTNTVKRLLGKCVPLKDDENKVFGYLELVHDNTEYYSKNEQLQSGITKLKMAVNTGKAFFWEYDIEKDLISIDYSLTSKSNIWNSYSSGQSSPEPTLTGHLERLHPEDVDRIYNQSIQPLLKGDIDHFTATYRQLIHGEYEWLTSNFRTYKYDDNGKPSHIICYTTNVTQQRENEIELIKIKEADKLKTAFIENMSHEIRTPLNAIIGFSNIITDLNYNEENKHFIELINQNSEQLLLLVDDMLDFSKLESNTLEYNFNFANIKEVCAEVIESKKSRLKRGVKLYFDTTLPSILIHSDKKRIKQVIYHLIDNAIKFTPQGSITLSYSLNKEKEDTLTVSIGDTGTGLSKEEIDRIFSIFYKTDSFKEGIGLGLPLSKRIIEDLGGTVGVESKEGEGSTFWFNIPIKTLSKSLKKE